jgi:CRP/FNR family cyclic AMP-dependent transcriptional regulator
MINRFAGLSGKPSLLLALQSQSIVRDDRDIATALANKTRLLEHPVGSTIVTEGSADNELYLILSGRVVIRVKSRDIAYRCAGTHFGEMALIDPSAQRSASVVAVEPTITARISEQDFRDIAEKHPKIWRYLATELGNRLRQRNRYVSQPNAVPVVFIGSSKESTPILKTLVAGLDNLHVILLPWTADLFWPSKAAIEDLETLLPNTDFAVLVFGPDDTTFSRHVAAKSPRDNVLLEFGMFLGAIGRTRTYFLKPKGIDIKVPSDLFGLKPLEYDYDAASGKVDISGACVEIMRCIERYGVK